jgi:hypothetical protein
MVRTIVLLFATQYSFGTIFILFGGIPSPPPRTIFYFILFYPF